MSQRLYSINREAMLKNFVTNEITIFINKRRTQDVANWVELDLKGITKRLNVWCKYVYQYELYEVSDFDFHHYTAIVDKIDRDAYTE